MKIRFFDKLRMTKSITKENEEINKKKQTNLTSKF